jgi:hypothetical protein
MYIFDFDYPLGARDRGAFRREDDIKVIKLQTARL